jgi:hypothetical protein
MQMDSDSDATSRRKKGSTNTVHRTSYLARGAFSPGQGVVLVSLHTYIIDIIELTKLLIHTLLSNGAWRQRMCTTNQSNTHLVAEK